MRSPIASRWGVAFLASFFLLCQGVAQGLSWIDGRWDASRTALAGPPQTSAQRTGPPLESLGPVAAEPVCFDIEAGPLAGLPGRGTALHF